MCKLHDYSNKHLSSAEKRGMGGGGGGGGSLPNPGHPKYAANDSTLLIFSWFLCFRVGGGSILSISHIS